MGVLLRLRACDMSLWVHADCPPLRSLSCFLGHCPGILLPCTSSDFQPISLPAGASSSSTELHFILQPCFVTACSCICLCSIALSPLPSAFRLPLRSQAATSVQLSQSLLLPAAAHRPFSVGPAVYCPLRYVPYLQGWRQYLSLYNTCGAPVARARRRAVTRRHP